MRGESNEYVSENEIIEVEWKENKKKKSMMPLLQRAL